MAIRINLLPGDSQSLTANRKVNKQLKSIMYILIPLYVVMILVFLGVYLFNFFRIRNLTARSTAFKDQIKALETTEQKLYLVKDRLSKLKTAETTYKIKKPIENANLLLTIVPTEAVVSEFSVDEQKSSISLSFPTSDSFSSFLRSLYTSNLFSSVVMESFGFNTTGGYLLTLNLK